MAAAEKPAKPAKLKKGATPSPEVIVETPPKRWMNPHTLISLAFLFTIVGLAIALQRVLPDLTDRPEYQFAMEETRITPPHGWVPKTILAEVLQTAELPETVSLLDPDLCRKVVLAWERHPWIKQVNSVRITAEPALIVDLEYRSPAAFVEVSQGFYPVDTDGVLLPPSDFSMAETHRLPHIRNIRTLPQGQAGEDWGDIVLTSAARLAAILAPEQNLTLYWTPFDLKAIVAPVPKEMPPVLDQLTFELETAGGNRIVWGKAPGVDTLEPSSDVKLARMAEYKSRFGTLDGVNGLHRIDIRLFDGISLQPLNETLYR